MKPASLVGILLIVLGVLALAYQGITYTEHEKLIDIGPIQATRETKKTSLREKVVKIGAKVISHGRYLVFQMAEVAVPRELFRGILNRIARLRPPDPALC